MEAIQDAFANHAVDRPFIQHLYERRLVDLPEHERCNMISAFMLDNTAFIEQLRDCYENFVRWRSGNVNEVLTVLSQCDYNIDEAFEQLKPKENNMNDSAMPEAAAIPNPQSQRQDYVMGNFPQALHSTAPPQNRRSHSASITHCDNSNQSLPLDGSDDEVATATGNGEQLAATQLTHLAGDTLVNKRSPSPTSAGPAEKRPRTSELSGERFALDGTATHHTSIDEQSTSTSSAVPLHTDNNGADKPGPSHVSARNNMHNVHMQCTIERHIANVDPTKRAILSNEQQEQLMLLMSINGAVDPHYLIDQLVRYTGNENAVTLIFEHLLTNEFPLLETRLALERQLRRRTELTARDKFDVARFLEQVPEPRRTYEREDTAVTDLYKMHAKVYLCNLYPYLRENFVNALLKDHNYHLYPTVKALSEHFAQCDKRHRESSVATGFSPAVNFGETSIKKRLMRRISVSGWKPSMPQSSAQPRERRLDWPQQFDENFFLELQFVEMESYINEATDKWQKERRATTDAYTQAGLLMTCAMCFQDDCLPHEMFACERHHDAHSIDQAMCAQVLEGVEKPADLEERIHEPNDHVICLQCLRSHCEVQCEQGAERIACTAANCEGDFPLSAIKRVLKTNVFQMFERRRDQKSLRDAGLDLSHCPFCDFAMIIDDPALTVFRCLNQDCLKSSCRTCNRPNHLPKSCEEAARGASDDERTRLRVFIEEKMATALIRHCPKCKTAIIKSTGCDHMTCTTCHAHFCYRCCYLGHGANDVYQHHAKCRSSLSANMMPADLQRAAVLEAGRQAREQYLNEHPELADSDEPLMPDDIIKSLVDSVDKMKQHSGLIEQPPAAAFGFGELLQGRHERAQPAAVMPWMRLPVANVAVDNIAPPNGRAFDINTPAIQHQLPDDVFFEHIRQARARMVELRRQVHMMTAARLNNAEQPQSPPLPLGPQGPPQ